MDNLAEADIEIAKGELWKAKEILHKSVKYSGYNVELYEKLGCVLLKMGDKFEAGKYLFLSGIDDPEYHESVKVFLERYRSKPHNLFHPFPRAAKLPRITDYPDSVAEKLREIGFTDEIESVHQIGRPRETGISNKIALVILVAILVSILVLLGLGIVKLFELLF